MEKTISIPYFTKVNIYKLLVEIGAAQSQTKAKQLVSQGAVELFDDREADPQKVTGKIVSVQDGSIIHCGKNFWRQLQLPRKTITVDVQKNSAKVLAIN